MSADNTIGILITRRRDGDEGQEYRVAHVQAIDNLWYKPDYPSVAQPVLNRHHTLLQFADASVFKEAEAAMYAAMCLEQDVGYVEYGIRLLNYTAIYFPAPNRKRPRSRNWQRMGQRA